MKIITIIGAGMMGSALAFPARENGNEVRLVGTPLDREIIDAIRQTNRHPKFVKSFVLQTPEIGQKNGFNFSGFLELRCVSLLNITKVFDY